jgi:hypothetical protein
LQLNFNRFVTFAAGQGCIPECTYLRILVSTKAASAGASKRRKDDLQMADSGKNFGKIHQAAGFADL